MPRLNSIAVLLALMLLAAAAPSAAAQAGLAAQPEELWEEFPLDSDKSPPPEPEGQQAPPPEPEGERTAPRTSAAPETERAADEPGGGGGLPLWLLPAGGLLAFIGGVFVARGALALTKRRRETRHGRKVRARTEATPARASVAEPQSVDRSWGAVVDAPGAAVAMSTTGRTEDGSQRAALRRAKQPSPEVVESTQREQRTASVLESSRTEQPSRDVAEPPRVDPPPEVPELPQEAEESSSEVTEPTTAKEPSPDAVEPTETEGSPPDTPAPVEAEQPAPVEAEQPAPVEAEQPAPPQRMLELPDDVIPFPTRPGRGARRLAASVPQRALGYVSAVDADAHGSELEAQTEQIREACVRNGFESVEVVRDFESHSGSDLERPGLNYAIERLEAGDAGCLVVASLERLTRSAAHLGTLIDRLSESDIRLVVLDIELDTGNPDGRLAAEALANVGTLERKSLDTRTRKGLKAAREARGSSGRPSVADRPALKERIAQMRARGMTLQAIADTLNAEGVPTLRGGVEWRPSSVQAAVGYKRPKRGARKSANAGAGGGSGDGRN